MHRHGGGHSYYTQPAASPRRCLQAFMRQLKFSILFFLSLSSYGQKNIDTIRGTFNNKASWYQENKKWDDKMGLADLLITNDSLRIRFRDGFSIVDLVLNKQGQIEANSYSYLFKLNKKNKSSEVIYNKFTIDKKIALEFLDTLNKLGISDFYDCYKVPKYPIRDDGIIYTFEFSTEIKYNKITFSSPIEALDLKEGKAVYEFAKYADKLLGLNKNFSCLRQSLNKGRYKIAEDFIYTVGQ